MLANSIWDIHYGLSFPPTNWQKQQSFRAGTLTTTTPFRALRGFLKALNFSLYVFSCLMIEQVKNEALEQSLDLESLHLALLKRSFVSNIILLAYLSFTKIIQSVL